MTPIQENFASGIHPIGGMRWMNWWPIGAALLSGILLALAFPPLGWWPLAYVALIPLLMAPAPRTNGLRILCGAAFGYSHFLIALWWLNTVGFGAGMILALVCACFLTIWYWMISVMLWEAKPREVLSEKPSDVLLQSARRLGTGLWAFQSRRHFFLNAIATSALWVALEWLRSWLFTGFPWNLVGISQAFAPTRLLATLAGPYGISFLAILANFLLAGFLARKRDCACACTICAIALCITGWCLWESRRPIALESTPIRITAIQGNVPECREWDEAILMQAWQSYVVPTSQAYETDGANTDLFLWPEGAMPCTLTSPGYANGLRALLRQIQKPLMLGALDERRDFHSDQTSVFNSAFLLTAKTPFLTAPYAQRQNYYDKTHLVPFGEYVPFSQYVPWLNDVLGLGRDLTPGKDFPLFQLPRQDDTDIACGVNICFEDVFPEISRRFTLAGAQMLVTITNDCWYGTSAGARQHLAHAIFRAVENRRPLLRSGNNSDTCLITEKGEVLETIRGEDGNPFCEGWHTYQIYPVQKGASTTLYARCGNLFSWLCTAFAILFYANLTRRKFHRKKLLRDEKGSN